MVVDGVKVKRCGHCGRFVPLTGFHKNCKAWDGIDATCKECKKAIMAEWRRLHHRPKQKKSPSYKHVTMEDGQEGKMCSKCMEVKPLSEFGVANSHWDKLSTQCKTCTQQYGRDRYKRICLKRWEAKEQPKTAADGDKGSGKTTACGE